MALSGSYDISTTRTIICQAAMRKLGALAEGQTATSASIEIVVEALNFMIKAWAAEGMPVFYLDEAYLYPMENVNTFTLGTAGDHFSQELGITKLTDNAASAATTITVSTSTAIDVQGTSANSDNIGIEMDDGTIHWTTISSGGGTATLVIAAGTDDAATSNNRVFYYTSKGPRPVEIEGVWRVNAASQDQIEVNPASLTDMIGQSNLTTEGPPIEYNYQAFLNASPPTLGRLRVWPRFENGDEYLRVLFQLPFDDIDAAANSLSFPQEWYEAVVYGLAVRIAPEYKVPLQERMVLKEEAKAMKERAEMSARENASITFQPNFMWGNNG